MDKLNEASGCDTSLLPTDVNNRYHPNNVPLGCYRLPTESEWEYAARGGTTTTFSHGADEDYSQLTNYAWYNKNAFDVGESHPDYGSHPGGGKLPNPFNLYDMHGNVAEWTHDRFGLYDSVSKIDPIRASTDNHKIFRGSWWAGGQTQLRSAARSMGSRQIRFEWLGFRLLLVAGPQGGNNSTNVSPIASNDMASTNINQSITVDALVNDSDDNDLLTITHLSYVSGGSASIVSGSSAIFGDSIF